MSPSLCERLFFFGHTIKHGEKRGLAPIDLFALLAYCECEWIVHFRFFFFRKIEDVSLMGSHLYYQESSLQSNHACSRRLYA